MDFSILHAHSCFWCETTYVHTHLLRAKWLHVFALRWLIGNIKIIAAPDVLKKRITRSILAGQNFWTFFDFLAKIAHFGTFGVHVQ